MVSVFPNKVMKPLTTRSWDFLGMTINVQRNIRLETNMIIGVLDTGHIITILDEFCKIKALFI